MNDTTFEPDLTAARENIQWCEHWALFYPVWWGSVPALLKGFIDRTITSGFGFAYHKNDPMWDKLLTGRSAHIITTSDSPWWWILLQYRNSDVNAVKQATLKFCGIQPVRVTRISQVRSMTPDQREQAIRKMRTLL